jgi:hypothetical protein
MTDLSNELVKLIARASGTTPPEALADNAVVLVQKLLPAGVGAPQFDAGILERANGTGTVLQPHVMALQAAYEVIRNLMGHAEKMQAVIDAAYEFDLCLEGDLPATVFSEKQMKLHQALEALTQ